MLKILSNQVCNIFDGLRISEQYCKSISTFTFLNHNGGLFVRFLDLQLHLLVPISLLVPIRLGGARE